MPGRATRTCWRWVCDSCTESAGSSEGGLIGYSSGASHQLDHQNEKEAGCRRGHGRGRPAIEPTLKGIEFALQMRLLARPGLLIEMKKDLDLGERTNDLVVIQQQREHGAYVMPRS